MAIVLKRAVYNVCSISPTTQGDWTYWIKRMNNGYGGLPTRISKLIKRQKGRCNHCGYFFTDEDLVEIDHIQPKSSGGKDIYSNLQLLHRHCHDLKTRLDGSSTRDKGQQARSRMR